MDRSTIKETTTKTVNTEATDQVGVKASDLISVLSSAISEIFSSKTECSRNLYSKPNQTSMVSNLTGFYISSHKGAPKEQAL